MPNNFLHRQLDHFLQVEIISRLAATDKPIRFSDLKDAGIENSLFMYHANKLIDRGLIRKTKDGFGLTLKGTRWANYAGVFHDFAVLTPRPLVQFIIPDNHGNVLLAVRKGQLRQQLNDLLLPGNIYRYGLTLEESVSAILEEIFGPTQLPAARPITTADTIHTSEDGFVNHVISYIFMLQPMDAPPARIAHPLFTTEWWPVDDIRVDNPRFEKSMFVATLFDRLPSVQPHEVFRLICK